MKKPWKSLFSDNSVVHSVNIEVDQTLRSVVTYKRLKTMENSKTVGLSKKVVVVAHERWYFTKGSDGSDLTGKIIF